ncbi:MAG: DUF1684 domain-containing protein [Chloroflexi bacterium]|nr:MAG: DUF1684 domain-containing protein [Chloroflexota bacterium]
MSDLDEYRAAKDAYFRDGSASPLTAAQRAHFDGLRYYPEAPALVFELVPELLPPSAAVEMATSTGDTALYQRWARVTFEVDGAPVALTIFHDPMLGGLFLPFQDSNAGGETYGAGRYLEVQELGPGELLLDFNYATNPYCAYGDGWSCPIPPPENHLAVAIRAGEMTFEGGH